MSNRTVATTRTKIGSNRTVISARTINSSRIKTNFSPKDIPGLVLWLDASIINLANNAPVSTWNDSSGLGNNATQATPANQPTFITSSQNSKGGVSFVAANISYLLLSNSVALTLLSTNKTVIIVISNTTFIANACLIGVMNGASSSRFLINEASTSAKANFLYTTGAAGVSADTNANSIIYTNPNILSVLQSLTTFECSILNRRVLAFSNAGSEASTAGASIGAKPTAANPSTTHINEVLVFNTNITDLQRNTLMQYLSSKWNIGVVL